MDSTNVILFDDNDSVRDSISMLLQDVPGYILVASYAHCLDVIQNISETNPDVVLMDIDMPGMNGIEGVALIRNHFPNIKVLMLTVFEDEEKIFASIKAGADGYILKNTEPKLLIAAINEVHNGGAPMTPSIARKVLQQFQTILPDTNKENYHLSKREREVLGLLVDGLSYKMIAAKLSITYDTVRAHMKKIYEKLHVASMTEAVAKAINQKI